LEEQNIIPANIKMIDGGSLEDYLNTNEAKETLGVSKKGFSGYRYKKSLTIDGYDGDGNFFTELLIENPDGGIAVVQVEDDNLKSLARKVYTDLYNSSDYKLSLDGEKGLANLEHMPNIKRSMLKNSRIGSSGKITVNIPGKGSNHDLINYKKNNDGTFTLTLKYANQARVLDYKGSTKLKGEAEIALVMKKVIDSLAEEISYKEMISNKK